MNSIKTRVTISVLLIFLLSLWAMTFYTSLSLRQDLQKLLGEEQLTKANYVANRINDEFEERFLALSSIAANITPALLNKPEQLQIFLERYSEFRQLFNGGMFITQADGTAYASVPRLVQRAKLNFFDRDYIRTPIETGKKIIGRPVLGRQLIAPMFGMGVPIRDAHGKIIGSLAGITDLSHENFLDSVSRVENMKFGSYLIAAPQHQVFISGSDKSLVMHPMSASQNAIFSRHVNKFAAEYGLQLNSRGDEELTSIKSIALPGWHLYITLPSKIVFAPITAMNQRIFFAAFILTIVAAGLTWWILKRQLSPIFLAVNTITSLIEKRQALHPLPVIRQDEIGRLIQAFNHVIRKMTLHDEELKESEARFRTLTEMSSDFYWESDHVGRFISRTYSKQQSLAIADVTNALIGVHLWQIPGFQAQPIALERLHLHLKQHQAFREFELSTEAEAHDLRCLSLSGDPVFNNSGKFQGYRGVAKDITVRKQAEAEFRLAASAFNTQEAMIITDADGVILRVNKAFTQNMGYLPEEILGKTPRHLKSGAHDPAFYEAMWQSINEHGSWQGEILDQHKNGELLPYWLVISTVKNADQKVTHYIGAHYDLRERKLAAERINHLSYFDQLTDLPNRHLLIDRIQQNKSNSIRNDRYCALLSIDIDLKGINDLLGHEIGDQLIRQVAGRLNQCVPEGSTVARIGGDDFIVMLTGLSRDQGDAASHTEEMATRIRHTLNEAYLFDEYTHHSNSSIGVSLFKGHELSVEVLLKQVNLAMGRAKEEAKNGICFFDPAMEIAVIKRAAMENDLHTAVEDRQLQLYYQAQFVDNGRLVGAEVLVRWRHPERGIISPAEFIPLAEESGLILPLGAWVLESACHQLALWQNKVETAHLTLAVNVSAQQFRQKDFVPQVLTILSRSNADPKRLKLELTESLLVSEIESVIEKMFALKAKGIAFALDDFGTGYSSLSYLKRLPLDQLKIDQSFVRDVLNNPNDTAIVKTIIALGRSLGLGVIAEGVEFAEQRDFLLQADCHAYQGYFYGKPMPIEEFESHYADCLYPNES